VPPHPDVFVAVVEEVGERVHDLLAVADEHLPGRALEQPVAQQREQRRHEQRVG
jgi:hypothetical protein